MPLPSFSYMRTHMERDLCLQLPGKKDTALGRLKIHPLDKVQGNLAPDRRPPGSRDSIAGSRAPGWRGAQAGVHQHHPTAKKIQRKSLQG